MKSCVVRIYQQFDGEYVRTFLQALDVIDSFDTSSDNIVKTIIDLLDKKDVKGVCNIPEFRLGWFKRNEPHDVHAGKAVITFNNNAYIVYGNTVKEYPEWYQK